MLFKANKYTVKIEGMMCAHCSKRVEDGLSSLDEVSKVKVDLGRKEATIVCKSDVEIKDIEQI